MNPELTISLIELVDTLAQKNQLSGTEWAVYQRGLEFIELNFRMYNMSLRDGVDELDGKRDTDEDIDMEVNPSYN